MSPEELESLKRHYEEIAEAEQLGYYIGLVVCGFGFLIFGALWVLCGGL